MRSFSARETRSAATFRTLTQDLRAGDAMTDLRKMAAGRGCQVRYPGICNHDSSTTVLAHIRLAGITGTGMKAPDALGAWCCSSCHEFADARVPASGWTKEEAPPWSSHWPARE